MTNTTSRTPILDQVLAIRNLLALSDHELEEITNIQQEKEEAMNLVFETERERKTLEDAYNLDITSTAKQYRDHYKLRKELQSSLFTQYDIDHKYRCQFKHKLTIQEALKEIADATDEPQDRMRFNQFTHSLYMRIGKITGLWHTPCGRCLLDADMGDKEEQATTTSSTTTPMNTTSTPTPTPTPFDDEPHLYRLVSKLIGELSPEAFNESYDKVTRLSRYMYPYYYDVDHYLNNAIINQNEKYPKDEISPHLEWTDAFLTIDLFSEAITFAWVLYHLKDLTYCQYTHEDFQKYFNAAFNHLRWNRDKTFNLSQYIKENLKGDPSNCVEMKL